MELDLSRLFDGGDDFKMEQSEAVDADTLQEYDEVDPYDPEEENIDYNDVSAYYMYTLCSTLTFCCM